jgi:hypothetical protein
MDRHVGLNPQSSSCVVTVIRPIARRLWGNLRASSPYLPLPPALSLCSAAQPARSRLHKDTPADTPDPNGMWKPPRVFQPRLGSKILKAAPIRLRRNEFDLLTPFAHSGRATRTPPGAASWPHWHRS